MKKQITFLAPFSFLLSPFSLLLFSFLLSPFSLKAQQEIRDQFLVDKIYNNRNNSLVEYIYDEHNRPIKRRSTNNLIDYKDTDVFEYENGRVSKIIYTGDPVYHFDTYLYYNEQGQLIREEIYVGGRMTEHTNFHYENGIMVSIYDDNMPPFERDTIFYDHAGNVIKRTRLMGNENPRWHTDYFEYDDHPRPNFGIDYLLMYQPFPGMGTAAILEKNLSKNNMTKGKGETWIYTYDEYGLPKTIQFGSLILTLTYKPITSNINEFTQPKVTVYPNPTTGQLTIENGELRMENVEIYDIMGRKQKIIINYQFN